MSTSKEIIIESLRRNRAADADLPTVAHDWTTYEDSRAKFIEILKLVGGQTITVSNAQDLNEQLLQLPQFANAQRIASRVPNVAAANVDLALIASPHDMADIDVAVLPGEFAVAENAAVWVTDQDVLLRVLFFLCQHLVLVVPRDQIVDHMHAAYDRLSTSNNGESAFSSPRFGAFISGPSKTADIEQSLVIGAHGPRSLVVCFVEQ